MSNLLDSQIKNKKDTPVWRICHQHLSPTSPKSMLPISKPWRAFCKWYQGGILGSILLSLFLQVDDQIDLFISQRGFESILYYLIFVVFLLSIFPSTDVSNPVSHTVWVIPNFIDIMPNPFFSAARMRLFFLVVSLEQFRLNPLVIPHCLMIFQFWLLIFGHVHLSEWLPWQFS